ncbi:MAG: hypothetical protein F6K09_08395, partial [Merismopedia sp. SIO2A8]|nr:hypothetical protein [Merismopedia sp. SIO2A8]
MRSGQQRRSWRGWPWQWFTKNGSTQRQPWLSLSPQQRQFCMILGSIVAIAVSSWLIYQSLRIPFSEYRTYQQGILQLRSLEAEFNQEILKSQYELFTSYDALVQNLANQEALQTRLTEIPTFVEGNERRTIQRLLTERAAALEQKDNLSEWFKSRNALLKNSLRYLPFLTEQLETTFQAQSSSIANAISSEGSDRTSPPFPNTSLNPIPPNATLSRTTREASSNPAATEGSI